MRFIGLEDARAYLRGKRVAVVGGGPSALENKPGLIDSHDVVVRVNNYRLGEEQGWRCDVFYSFFGTSIRKTAHELTRDGVKLCWAKCPNGKPLESRWHEDLGRTTGIDFRYIYENRREWWFCDTFIPEAEHFLRGVKLLEGHVPTTGFSAVVDAIEAGPAALHVTGFDFFRSGQHNVDERWRPGNPADPIGHLPELEREWMKHHLAGANVTTDRTLAELLR